MESAIKIGASSTSIKEAKAGIMEILKCASADQSTKVAALEALVNITSVNNTTISGCNFTVEPSKK